MKNLSFNLLAMLLISLAILISCKQKEQKVEGVYYTCPMHPDVNKEEPGACPICGMDLVKKEK